MKIKMFVDAHVFDGKYQGTTTYLKGLYNELAKDQTFEITLAANDVGNLRNQFAGVSVNYLQLRSKSKWVRLFKEIPAILRSGNYDFAHFQYITPLAKPCRYINTVHDLLFLDFPRLFPLSYRFVKRLTFYFSAKRADIVCTVSEYSKVAIQRHFGIGPDKIVLTPNAVEAEAFTDTGICARYGLEKFILCVSRFEPRKNHIVLLKAFIDEKLYAAGYKLVFVGARVDVAVPDFEKLINSLDKQIREQIVFLEGIGPSELHTLYRNAALFVYPSLAEGFGLPPLEAAVAGCRVICSNQTAMADFGFFEGYQFDPYRDDLGKIICRVIGDENYPFKRIREGILERYKWSRVASEFASALKARY